eukprot:TRINITY_DN14552_c0_g1_i1.p1 TRINITY_DN14552_c0_g1~~TRINITY_DN14552_c0_g1_i1.p1  ORF type:complete len:184 (+),score=20.24 TRINITY_DN14552_c0_g1_i1:157-708(+)
MHDKDLNETSTSRQTMLSKTAPSNSQTAEREAKIQEIEIGEKLFTFMNLVIAAMSLMRIYTSNLKAEVYNHRCEGYANYKEVLRLPSYLWLVASLSFLLSFKLKMRLRTRLYQSLLIILFAFNMYAFAKFLKNYDDNFGYCLYGRSSEKLRLASFLIEFIVLVVVFIYANSIHSKRVKSEHQL